MRDYYIDNEHKTRMLNLITSDNTHLGDVERISLLYIISGNEDLYRKKHAIYDFKEHCIKACMKNRSVDLSSGTRSLVRLGFNLYNGYRDKYTTPMDIFYCLDNKNRYIAENAIRLRLGDRLLEQKE